MGDKVLVYGEIGEVQRARPVGNGRYRYTILFQEPPRIKDYTVPPTTIERLKGPLERVHLIHALIDQIVYRLYGLTEEGIQIVEGG